MAAYIKKIPVLEGLDSEQGFHVRRLPQGGWLVTQPDSDRAVMPKELGAFSNEEDLLVAINSALGGE